MTSTNEKNEAIFLTEVGNKCRVSLFTIDLMTRIIIRFYLSNRKHSQLQLQRGNQRRKLKSMSCHAPSEAESKSCIPCESLDTSYLLSSDQVIQSIKDMKLWVAQFSSSDESKIQKLSKKFTCRNFQSALDAINDVGAIAEREGHHPDLHLTSYRDVEIELYTHSVGGVTMNDIALAKMIDNEVKVKYSPKYLRENGIISEAAKQD